MLQELNGRYYCYVKHLTSLGYFYYPELDTFCLNYNLYIRYLISHFIYNDVIYLLDIISNLNHSRNKYNLTIVD